LLAACQAHVAVAPFSERPDSTRPGLLRGPFDGQVLESPSGNPIAAALVLGVWSYHRLGALSPPLYSVERSVLTRSDGTYELPAVRLPSQPDAVLARFTLIVYKAGYLGYRSDFRTDDRTPRHDFAQRRHRVRLERFPAGESHARHLVFLGGSGTLRRAAQNELQLAALELSEAHKPPPPPPAAPEPPPLPEASSLLLSSDVEALAPKGMRFLSEPLLDTVADRRRGPAYDSVHYRAPVRGEAYDAALRLWRPESVPDLLARLKAALPRAEARDVPLPSDRTAPATVAFDEKRRVRGVVLSPAEGLVLQLLCGAALCPKEETLLKLLSQAVTRLSEATTRERPALLPVTP
jgi:hypothetical protein